MFTLPSNKETGRGVHSTTWRELITLKNGAHVIDTPGLRELGYVEVNQGIVETFTDIKELSKSVILKTVIIKILKVAQLLMPLNRVQLKKKDF